MGASPDDPDAEDNERPRHEAAVHHAFYMALYPVTRELFRRFIDAPEREHGALSDDSAVNWVSCNDADHLVRLLNERSVQGLRYRLPTEVEWEYACRAGTQTRFHFGDDPGYRHLTEFAWCAENTWEVGECCPQPVGLKPANAFGLFDMHGNVWEWTSDRWVGYEALRSQGAAATREPTRVLRGGGFCHEGRYLRASDRDHYAPTYRHYYTGMRLCLDAQS